MDIKVEEGFLLGTAFDVGMVLVDGDEPIATKQRERVKNRPVFLG